MSDLIERFAHETEYPHKRLWRISSQFRPLLQAYGRVWEKQAGPVTERGGSPIEAMEEEVADAEDPIIQAIAGIDLERDNAATEITRLTSALAASEEARRAERAAVVWECAEIAEVWDKAPYVPKQPPSQFYSCTQEILALATDADNAALDKLLREAVAKACELEFTVFREGGCTGRPKALQYFITQMQDGRFFAHWRQDDCYFDSLDEAKKAAQADRILAALEAQQ